MKSSRSDRKEKEKDKGGVTVGTLLTFKVGVPSHVEHKSHKLSKCIFVKDGVVLAQYQSTSAMRLFRLIGQVRPRPRLAHLLTSLQEFQETKLLSTLSPPSIVVVQHPYVASVHATESGETLRITDLSNDAFPTLQASIPPSHDSGDDSPGVRDDVAAIFVDSQSDRVVVVRRDLLFHFAHFDFSVFGGDTRCFAVPIVPRLAFRPVQDQCVCKGKRALLLGGTKLALLDLMTGRELLPTRTLDMPVRPLLPSECDKSEFFF